MCEHSRISNRNRLQSCFDDNNISYTLRQAFKTTEAVIHFFTSWRLSQGREIRRFPLVPPPLISLHPSLYLHLPPLTALSFNIAFGFAASSLPPLNNPPISLSLYLLSQCLHLSLFLPAPSAPHLSLPSSPFFSLLCPSSLSPHSLPLATQTSRLQCVLDLFQSFRHSHH